MISDHKSLRIIVLWKENLGVLLKLDCNPIGWALTILPSFCYWMNSWILVTLRYLSGWIHYAFLIKPLMCSICRTSARMQSMLGGCRRPRDSRARLCQSPLGTWGWLCLGHTARDTLLSFYVLRSLQRTSIAFRSGIDLHLNLHFRKPFTKIFYILFSLFCTTMPIHYIYYFWNFPSATSGFSFMTFINIIWISESLDYADNS